MAHHDPRTTNESRVPKIYCAGPLFNDKEKQEMQEIAAALERAGFAVFLPHRDGFEFFNLFAAFAKLNVSEAEARRILSKAIFCLDVFHVLSSDGVVVNANGRVPDEGAMVEVGIAWNSGKKIVLYKNDARSLLNGSDNPLLLGLSDFDVVTSIEDIPSSFNELRSLNGLVETKTSPAPAYEQGKAIASLASERADHATVCARLLEVLGENGNARIPR
jgi:nucleoside 2-deoxyribosyltransferase